MQAQQPAKVIDENDLRDIDRTLLDYLQEGRVTPVYCRKQMLHEEERESISRPYVQERLAWLVEHGHATNLHDCGLYELVDDPRND